MRPRADRSYTGFLGSRLVASGDILSVAIKIKKSLRLEVKLQVFIFDDLTGDQAEVDFRGDLDQMKTRLQTQVDEQTIKKSGPGRPRLGVISKEITLLPEHWEWLAIQPGGASVTLRKLIEEAKKKNTQRDQIRQAQDRAYKVMMVLAGDRVGYEEALRALYQGNRQAFQSQIESWPSDIREYTLALAREAFAARPSKRK